MKTTTFEKPQIFTVEEGIEIQQEHIEKWSMLAQPQIVEMVKVYVSIINKLLLNRTDKTGMDVLRGQYIDDLFWKIADEYSQL